MKVEYTYFIVVLFLFYSCASHTDSDMVELPESSMEKGLEAGDYTFVLKDSGSNMQRVEHELLPIHGTLDKKKINQYYPNMLDTVKDLRIIGSEPIDIDAGDGIYVSMLHNTGTFDQMFLCTHDKNFNLLDCYYVGLSTLFDRTSHTIEYNKLSGPRLEIHLFDWAYVKNEIDTVKHEKYILKVTKTGKITQK